MELNTIYDTIDRMDDAKLSSLARYIQQEQKTRRDRAARRLVAELKIGDKVVIGEEVKPRYLAGLTGTVLSINATKVKLNLTVGPVNKFRAGTLTAPISLLSKVVD